MAEYQSQLYMILAGALAFLVVVVAVQAWRGRTPKNMSAEQRNKRIDAATSEVEKAEKALDKAEQRHANLAAQRFPKADPQALKDAENKVKGAQSRVNAAKRKHEALTNGARA